VRRKSSRDDRYKTVLISVAGLRDSSALLPALLPPLP
jgi:hypothetical protein